MNSSEFLFTYSFPFYLFFLFKNKKKERRSRKKYKKWKRWEVLSLLGSIFLFPFYWGLKSEAFFTMKMNERRRRRRIFFQFRFFHMKRILYCIKFKQLQNVTESLLHHKWHIFCDIIEVEKLLYTFNSVFCVCVNVNFVNRLWHIRK